MNARVSIWRSVGRCQPRLCTIGCQVCSLLNGYQRIRFMEVGSELETLLAFNPPPGKVSKASDAGVVQYGYKPSTIPFLHYLIPYHGGTHGDLLPGPPIWGQYSNWDVPLHDWRLHPLDGQDWVGSASPPVQGGGGGGNCNVVGAPTALSGGGESRGTAIHGQLWAGSGDHPDGVWRR